MLFAWIRFHITVLPIYIIQQLNVKRLMNYFILLSFSFSKQSQNMKSRFANRKESTYSLIQTIRTLYLSKRLEQQKTACAYSILTAIFIKSHKAYLHSKCYFVLLYVCLWKPYDVITLSYLHNFCQVI